MCFLQCAGQVNAGLAGHHDGATGRVNLFRMAECYFRGHEENRPQHFDHIVIGMLVVVEQHHVVQLRVVFAIRS